MTPKFDKLVAETTYPEDMAMWHHHLINKCMTKKLGEDWHEMDMSDMRRHDAFVECEKWAVSQMK